MARPLGTSLRLGRFALVRTITAAPIANDPAVFSDASYPIAGAIDCTGIDVLELRVEVDGGTNVTVTLGPLFRDDDGPSSSGSKWYEMAMAGGPPVSAIAAPAVANNRTAALPATVTTTSGPSGLLFVAGCPFVFPRVVSVGGTLAGTTACRIMAKPYSLMQGMPRGFHG